MSGAWCRYCRIRIAKRPAASHIGILKQAARRIETGDLLRLMNSAQQQILFENTARAIKGASPEIVARHIDNCGKADPAYGAGVAEAIGHLGSGDLTAPRRRAAADR
jgi:catalase